MILIGNVFYNFGKGGDKTMGKITAYKVNNLSKVDLRFYKEGDHFITSRSVGMLTNGKMKILQSDLMTELNDLKNRVKALEEVGGRNYFSLTHLNSISPSSWVINAYVYNFELEPNTKYILSSNVPTAGNLEENVLYFNGSLTATNGVWLDNPQIMETDAEGKFYIAIPTGRTYTDGILNGTYWVQLEKGTKATDWKPAPEDL